MKKFNNSKENEEEWWRKERKSQEIFKQKWRFGKNDEDEVVTNFLTTFRHGSEKKSSRYHIMEKRKRKKLHLS